MAQHTPHTYSTGDTITAALLNQAEADLAAAIPKADADAAYDAKGAATAAQAAAVQRANHTGTQSADTLTDGTTNKAYTAAEKTKLAGVATAATANATDAALRDRSTHTGTQVASTVTGLSTVATSGAYTDLTAKPTIPTQYTDAQAVAANASALAGKAPQLTPTATKTAAYTAAVGDLAVMNVAGGATALTLPTAPADKAQVGFLAVGATTAAPLTVNRGGSDTLGASAATTVTVPLSNEVTVYQYQAASTRWLPVSNVKPLAALDGRYDAIGAATAALAEVVMPAPNGTDDTAALQAAINAAPTGSTVRFRTGTYLITSPLRFLGARAYVGSGYGYGATGTTIKQKDGANITNGAGLSGLLVANAWAIDQAGCDAPVRIENLYLDGNKANNPSSTACGLILCNYWSLVDEIQVVNTPKHAIHLTDVTANGVNVVNNSASENRISRCRIAGPGGHGISQLSSNTISNQDGFCLDNLITGVGQDGMNFQRGSGWAFRRNHLYGIAGNGMALNNCFANTITDNEIEDFGAAAVPSTFYAGISVTQLNGRGTHMTGNFVGCAEPTATGAVYQYLYAAAGVSQTDAQVIVTDNLVKGAGTAAGRAIVLNANGTGGTLGVLTAVAENNRVSNVSTEVFVATGNVVTGRAYGSKTIDGALTVGGLHQFKAHETSGGNPTVTVTAGGQAASAASSGGLAANDAAGQITATTIASPVAGGLATVTYGTAYAAVPRSVVLSPANAAAAACQPYVSSQTAAAFVISCAAAPAASTALLFNYRVTG